MSLSNPKPQNPCLKFIEFKGEEGIWRYFDKTLGEKGENVAVKTPFYFVVLDELVTIKGYSESLNSGLYANEVHNIIKEKLHVRSFKGNWEMIGLYSDIKDKVKNQGGKFTKSVYAMLLDEDGNHEMVNFQLKGASFSAWFDLRFRQDQNIICVTKITKDAKKGTNEYKIPVFTLHNMKPETLKRAIEMDKQLQQFFQARKQFQIDEQEVESTKAQETEHDFNEKFNEATDWESQEPEDDYIPPISDDELPF